MTKKLLLALVWLLDRISRIAGRGIIWGAPNLEELQAITRRLDQRVLTFICMRSCGASIRISERYKLGYYSYE